MSDWKVWIAVAAAAIIGAPAWALETGQCLPAAQVRSALTAEHMDPIIVGNRTGFGYPTALIFFANANGSRGYLVRGDKPLGEQAETACIDSIYREVRLNDITRPGIPAWAKVGGDEAVAVAAAICKRDHLGYQESCQLRDRTLVNLDAHGARVMFQATGTAINPRDKSVRENQLLLIAANPADDLGIVEAATKEGASYMLGIFKDQLHRAWPADDDGHAIAGQKPGPVIATTGAGAVGAAGESVGRASSAVAVPIWRSTFDV